MAETTCPTPLPETAPAATDAAREAYRAELPRAEVALHFLGSCLLEEPSAAYVETVMDPGLWEDLPYAENDPDAQRGLGLLRTWCAHADEAGAETAARELNVAWFRTFVGAGRPLASPWQSVYTDDESLLFSEDMRDVRRWYRRFGVEPARLNREPDDHLGLMLEFLAHLAGLERRCACNTEMAGLQRDQLDFVARHVDVFLHDWARDVEGKSGSAFYTGIALLVEAAVRTRTAQLAASPWLAA